MNERTLELLETLVSTYTDRLDDDQLDTLEEFLADDDAEGALEHLTSSLSVNRSAVSEAEMEDLQELYTLLEMDTEPLDSVDVE